MHEPTASASSAAHAPTREQHVARDPRAGEGYQPFDTGPARKVAAVDFRQGDVGAPGHHPQVARQRQLEASARGGALDGRDHRHGEGGDAIQELLARAVQRESPSGSASGPTAPMSAPALNARVTGARAGHDPRPRSRAASSKAFDRASTCAWSKAFAFGRSSVTYQERLDLE